MMRWKIENSDGSYWSQFEMPEVRVRAYAKACAAECGDDLLVYRPNKLKGLLPLSNPRLSESDWILHGAATAEGEWCKM
jgi:hypothetical protein